MRDSIAYFVTWTTYCTWLPGDSRGWRKTRRGSQLPQPLLEAWSRNRLSDAQITLNDEQRQRVETVCREHASMRGWTLHAVNARSNHVHLVVSADKSPSVVRDQFKAHATRALRQGCGDAIGGKIWTRGGDIQIVDDEEDLERVILYATAAQDRMDKEI